MTPPGQPVQQRYLELVQAIEDRFEVDGWRSGEVDLWPPARMDLYLDMFRSQGGDTAPPRPKFVKRLAGALATPVTNAWKSRGDLEHWLAWPHRSDAVLLGDGVSLDRIDGAWSDRHGEPVIEALERLGLSTLVMQPSLQRLPWRRPTYAANLVAVKGALGAALDRRRPLDLPDHDAVLAFLASEGAPAPSLSRPALARRARTLAATAAAFRRVLRAARPRLAFTVTYYAGLGHAFALACRAEGVMCVDLQHRPQEGAHRAYRWSRPPADGYTTLPAVFWTWSLQEAAHIAAWSDRTPAPWHAAVHGGHSQLAPFLDDDSPAARTWDRRVAAVGSGAYEREILVALQPIGGRRKVWEALAWRIEAAPSGWRWWIRRHPSSARSQDAEYAALVALKRPNVVIEEAADPPLPALLRRMDALVSLASGAAAEAALFGVPAFFLDEEALGTFAGLIERGQAEMVRLPDLIDRLAERPARPARCRSAAAPPIESTLDRLLAMAGDYRNLCREHPLAGRGPT
jgi:hypothetical protein